MRIRFKKNGVAHVPTSSGVKTVRGGEELDISEVDWLALESGMRAMFEVVYDPDQNIGEEIGYASREINDTTTNTNAANAAANKISGLSVEVVGIGRPILVEFFGQVYHSVAGGSVGVYLIRDGVAFPNGAQMGTVTVGRANVLYVPARLVLGDGVTALFEVGKYITGAGTGNYIAGAAFPMMLSVTQR